MPLSEDEKSPSRHSSPSNAQPKRSTPPQSNPQSTASYLSYPVSHVMSGLYRRLTEPTPTVARPAADPLSSSEVFTPPRRSGSPFQPPPLTPLTLKASGNASHVLLTRSLAEEIRLLVPPRLQLLNTWQLVYSLDRDGSSLATLYEHCKEYSHRSQRAGYVLVVRDASASPGPGGNNNGGAVFGAYLTDPPHPAKHYYGTGECFLWRASTLPSTPLVQVSTNSNQEGNANAPGAPEVPQSEEMLELAGLPLPPSADTTRLRGRSTTLRGENNSENEEKTKKATGSPSASAHRRSHDSANKRRSSSRKDLLRPPQSGEGGVGGQDGSRSRSPSANLATGASRSGTTTPERIRFKAFPYSGVNDYMMLCETGFLSVGGGDGHYGLWLDDTLEKGVSSQCLTFGNEPLSDEGTKFDVLGVEIWYIGS